MSNLFGSGFTGASFADGAPGLSLGTRIRFLTRQQVTAVRWRTPDVLPLLPVQWFLRRYTPGSDAVPGALLSSGTWSGLVAGAWNSVAVPELPILEVGEEVLPYVWTGDRYSAQPAMLSVDFFGPGGALMAPADSGAAHNGRFADVNVPSWPTSGNGASYFVDVECQDPPGTELPPDPLSPFNWDTSSELGVNRLNTQAFIAAHPTSLALVPQVMQKSGTGTLWVDQTPRAPQTVRLIDQSSTGGPVPGLLRTADGRQRQVQYQLLARYDALVGLWDTWTDAAGIRWQVAELFPPNGYEVRARVVRYGEG